VCRVGILGEMIGKRENAAAKHPLRQGRHSARGLDRSSSPTLLASIS
jgi:hypothetical protein